MRRRLGAGSCALHTACFPLLFGVIFVPTLQLFASPIAGRKLASETPREAKGHISKRGATLLKWLSHWDCLVHDGLEARNMPGKGRGLFTAQAVKAGTVLIQLSPEMMLPALEREEVRADLSAAFETDLALELRSCLAVIRAREDPQWQEYVAMWPTPEDFLGLPFFWDDGRLQEVAATMPSVAANVKERREFLSRAAKMLDVSAEDLKYAHALLCTRAVGGQDSCTLMPGVDFANHDPAGFNTRIMHAGKPGKRIGRATINQNGDVWEHGSAGLVAVQDIAADQEIRITYGNLSNDELLADYGFQLGASNPYGDTKDQAKEAPSLLRRLGQSSAEV
eukprot:TRINITY_DN64126_c0_g1_i1.p1 TRINITY_DN64126_c0_g1~~TRINITY_DN64126_c0_g1_i1.p1  ORF type:complete len:337 (-),score=32.75 TRINITY_DN64126_c0_g1_i1:59-1069(-)